MARKLRFWIFVLLAVVLAVFIFSNSLDASAESNRKSGWVAAFLRPLLNPRGRIPEQLYHALIRKLAHFAEFGLLGLSLGGAACNAPYPKPWCLSAGTALLIACCDETIQSFTGRTDSVWDVCLDFFGALCGIAFVWLCLWCRKRYKEARK